MSSSPRSHPQGEPDTDPTRWWIAIVTCAVAVPLWPLAMIGLQAAVGGPVLGVSGDEAPRRGVAISLALGLVCAVAAWRTSERAIFSGRCAGLAGALVLVGVLLLAIEDEL